MFPKKKKSPESEEQLQQDKHLIAKIQPQGGITFGDEKLIKTGDGYEIILHIYKYPKYIDKFWLTHIVNIDNVVVTIDIETKDQQKVKQNINSSMSEQHTRIMYAKDMQERIEAEDEFADLETLYNEVSRMNQVMKLIHVRLFVSGRTIAEVENNAKEIMNHLESNGYKSAVFLNECQHEWQSMFYPIGISNAEAAKIYARNGQPCTSSALAGGDPFHFTSLNDEYGSLYGTSTANGGGKIMLDLFHKDNQRTSYNGIIIGKMGSGKSTLLKKMLMDRAVRGDYIRGYDPSGEFRYLVEELGGSIVSLDGTDGILNMMQIMMSAEIDSVSYVQHISKLNTIYKFLVPDAPQPELLWYEKMIRKLYIKFGIIPEDEQIGGLVLTKLEAKEYPILSDLMEVIREEKALHGATDEAYAYICKIELVIENLITNYGYIFNGHTSIDDILSDQIVFFDIKNLAGMKSEIFDAQLFSSLSLCGSVINLLFNGKPVPFSSRFFFHENRNYLFTELNTRTKLSEDVSLTLKKWTYSKNDKAMMVMFSASNESLSSLELNWATYERHTEKLWGMDTGTSETKLKTEVKYPFENMVVVSITGVPANFEEVSLSLQLAADDNSSNKIVQFYSNIDKVETVEKIGDYTPTDYRIEYLGIQKNDKEAEIQALIDENNKLSEDNKSYHQSISELIADKEFETAEEIKETDRRISSYERQIKRNEEAIEQHKYDIAELRKAITDIEGAIEKMKGADQ